MRTSVSSILILFLTALSCGFGLAQTASQRTLVTGVVFEDKNENGMREPGEPGIPNVVVSNQLDAIQTDRLGRYALTADDATIIFITKPAGYDLPVDQNNLPQFYYVHQPAGSPTNLRFEGLKPTGELPEAIDFPLIKSAVKNNFLAIITGDPQPRDEIEVGYFREDIVSEMAGTAATFYLALGDIAYDSLEVYPSYNRAVAMLGIPAYNVHGNHDMNLDAPNDSLAAETFKRVFGPPDYSFNYGKVHFVVLDNVRYSGWNDTTSSEGSYQGFLTEKQLTWLRNDLSFVPEDHLIVLASHIPIVSELFPDHSTVNRERLFDILKYRNHLLATCGHLHKIEQLDLGVKHGWKGTAEFSSMSLGAACGAWWSGLKDDRGIPESFGLDGAPNGYFVFSFNGNRYNYHFYPAQQPPDYQMRIISPDAPVPADSLENTEVIVNVFSGGPKTKVMFSVAGDQFVRMQRKIMPDPFMVSYLRSHPHAFPGWIKNVGPSSHIWTAPLPLELEPGHHALVVQAVDRLGNIFKTTHMLEIIK